VDVGTWLVVVTSALLVISYAVMVLLILRARKSRDQAQADRSSALNAEREQIASMAVAAERNRIVREMHDVIAHSLAIMIAQADGGAYAANDSDAAQRAFTNIAETGRGALSDTRRILGLLRNPDADVELSPTPDEAGIDELVQRTEESGQPISLIRVGEPVSLPSASSLALYRICQEAITNVMKHAPGTLCVVTENWKTDAVVLTVTNDAVDAQPPGGTGQGLIGMRERAEIVGGSFSAGPIEDGWRVRAVIPYATLEDLDG
jgi:signal transduction histidine kinase